MSVPVPPPATLPPVPERPSFLRRLAGVVARHPARVAQAIFVALLSIVVLQNLEPTSLDVLFWTFPSLPKLVVFLIVMLAGGVVWEIVRRLIVR
jgi:uncharacterized integral membrane protein